ncbi:hypothetical protein JCM6882_004014 [Rhodosporidiobolus microsporus]
MASALPLDSPTKPPTLVLDHLHHRTDSPAPLSSPSSSEHPHHHHHHPSHLAPSPVPQDFGSPLPQDDASSFVDRGSLHSGARNEGDGDEDDEDDLDPARAQSLSAAARIFAQLETIKRLQLSIADAHAGLEGVAPLEPSSTAHGAGVGGKEGHKEKDKERERVGRAYETAQEEFEKREKGVEGIMAQLSDLSLALKTFHALPSPVLFPSPSSSSASPAPASPITKHPSPPANKNLNLNRRSVPQADPPFKSDSVPAPGEGEGERERSRQPPKGRGYSVLV